MKPHLIAFSIALGVTVVAIVLMLLQAWQVTKLENPIIPAQFWIYLCIAVNGWSFMFLTTLMYEHPAIGSKLQALYKKIRSEISR